MILQTICNILLFFSSWILGTCLGQYTWDKWIKPKQEIKNKKDIQKEILRATEPLIIKIEESIIINNLNGYFFLEDELHNLRGEESKEEIRKTIGFMIARIKDYKSFAEDMIKENMPHRTIIKLKEEINENKL